MKTVTKESCNDHNLHEPIKGIIPKLIYNTHILHYDVTKQKQKNTEHTLI